MTADLPPAPPPRIRSVQVGRPRTVGREDAEDPMERAWTSAFWKEAVAGPVHVGRTNLAGDAQADLSVHGGPDKAVLAYASAHYPDWRAELALPAMDGGAFGENLTVDGWTERTVCIGDVVSAGTALLEVAQPRGPCWKIARRWGIPDLTARVERSRRTGWYLRVLREGVLEAGQPLALRERPHAEWTVDRALRLKFHARLEERDELLALAAVPALAASWRGSLLRRAARLG